MKQTNIAFIDWQNLHLGTHAAWWKIDFHRLRVYLRDKFQITEAYYFLGFIDEDEQELYNSLQKAGFIMIFREHSSSQLGKKKWNVDTDIVFEVMKHMIDRDDRDQAVLVSWDGDYVKMVKYLIKHNRFKKILFPNKNHSSLYNPIQINYWINLSIWDVRYKIEYRPKPKTKKEMP